MMTMITMMLTDHDDDVEHDDDEDHDVGEEDYDLAIVSQHVGVPLC